MAISLLAMKQHDTANTQALTFLARLFRWSPLSSQRQLGEAFLEAGGPETLVHYLKSEDDHRNTALMAVLVTRKYFSDRMVQSSYVDKLLSDVRSQMETHAAMELPTLCDEFAPNAIDSQVSLLELQDYFEAAFHRRPQWAVEKVCTSLEGLPDAD
jgi:hypothetical protein